MGYKGMETEVFFCFPKADPCSFSFCGASWNYGDHKIIKSHISQGHEIFWIFSHNLGMLGYLGEALCWSVAKVVFVGIWEVLESTNQCHVRSFYPTFWIASIMELENNHQKQSSFSTYPFSFFHWNWNRDDKNYQKITTKNSQVSPLILSLSSIVVPCDNLCKESQMKENWTFISPRGQSLSSFLCCIFIHFFFSIINC